MSLPEQWHRDPHVPTHNEPTCGHRNTRNGNHCTRPAGHTGRHNFAWQHMPTLHGAIAGRVRDVWE